MFGQRWLPARLRTAGKLFLVEIALLNLGVGWITFWGLVVRLHYRHGDMANAAVTGVVYVLPAILGLGWHVVRVSGLDTRFGVSLPRPLSG